MGDDRVTGVLPLPAGLNQTSLLDLQHIGTKGQAHHIGRQTINDGPGLGARTAVAGFDRNALAGLLLPVGFELWNDLVIGRLGHGVADQEDRLGGSSWSLLNSCQGSRTGQSSQTERCEGRAGQTGTQAAGQGGRQVNHLKPMHNTGN